MVINDYIYITIYVLNFIWHILNIIGQDNCKFNFNNNGFIYESKIITHIHIDVFGKNQKRHVNFIFFRFDMHM